jgi:hypothetical protein
LKLIIETFFRFDFSDLLIESCNMDRPIAVDIVIIAGNSHPELATLIAE